MKKITLKLALLAAIIITASSCSKERLWVRGHGSDVQNTRQVTAGFTEITLDMDANVELYQDSVFSIEMNGQQNILDVIRTTSNGSRLKIDVHNFTRLGHHNTVTIRVHMPRLTKLDVTGSGNIQSMSNFTIDNLNANVSGSGDIYVDGTITGSLDADISGSGSMTFKGSSSCSHAKYKVSGSGDMNAEWLKAETVDAEVSGSGEIKLYAVKQLNAEVSGSGDIYYRGTPSTNVKISGSGKVRQIN